LQRVQALAALNSAQALATYTVVLAAQINLQPAHDVVSLMPVENLD
jgi:hypothetical protein